MLALSLAPLAAAQNIAIDNATTIEGDSGTLAITFPVTVNGDLIVEGNETFTVTPSAPVDRAVSFTASTSDGTANAPGDYAALTGQSFNIAAGVTTATVTVNVNGDNVVENDETFFVTPAAFIAAPPAGGQAPLDPATLIIPANDPRALALLILLAVGAGLIVLRRQ
jgi:hypothetical protein